MKLKAGVIGLGVGEAHIKGYEDHPQCEVVALCDFDEQKIEAAKKNYPDKKIASNAEDILSDPDIQVVSIASYDNYHYEQIVKAIENDKHIFVEKPLCLYEKEAVQLRKLLTKKPHIKVSSNLILRKCPRFIALKEKVAQGQLGELFHMEGDYNYGRLHKITEGWRGKIDFYSAVYGGSVHIIDLLLWIGKDEIVEVAAYGNNIASRGSQYKYNDSITSIFKFRGGATGQVSVHYGCVRPHFHNLNLYGTKATFVNTQEEGLLYDSMDPKAPVHKMTESYPGVHKGDLVKSFIEAIVNDTEAEVSKEDVFKTMSVCFAIEKAQVQSKPMVVNYI